MRTKLPFISACLGLLISIASAEAQQTKRPQINRCGTMEHTKNLIKKDPSLEQRLADANTLIENWIATHPQSANRTSGLPDTIPVVVHVVWKTANENISDAQIFSQMEILNEDYARTNPDTINTPAAFKPLASALPYRFVLARRDPNGNATTGITRTSTTINTFSDDDKVKFTAQGGHDAWNTNLYLNIWVCDLGQGFFGYGEFPSGTVTNTRGFVCNHISFGTIGTVQAPYDGGRTTTHELGHCFNLFHIWGDDFGSCGGNDAVTDTPNQGSENYTTPSYPHLDNCSPTAPGVMFMNYMDYTDDEGMNMFSIGQATRINAAVNSFYSNLLNSVGIQPVITGIDDYVAAIKLSVFPNPSQGNFHVDANNLPSGNRMITVTDLMGKIVFERAVEPDGNVSEDVDLSSFASGIYTLKLTAGKQQTNHKIVLNH